MRNPASSSLEPVASPRRAGLACGCASLPREFALGARCTTFDDHRRHPAAVEVVVQPCSTIGENRRDPIAQGRQFGTQAVQERQILQRFSDHQIPATARPAPVAVLTEERLEYLLLHARIRTSIIPCPAYLPPESGTGVDLHLRLCWATEQRSTPCFDLSLERPHRVRARAVSIRKEQPEIIVPVEIRKLFPNDRHRVRISANPWLPWHLHSGGGSAGVRHDSLHQRSQYVAVVGLIFRNNEHLHSAASNQPSANRSERGYFADTSGKCGTSVSGRIVDSPVSSSRLQTKVVRYSAS